MLADNAPIAAIATAPGRGGIGVVRVSGRDVSPIVDAVCGRALQPRQATYLPFRAADGRAIDHGLALLFPAPHSYTGETVLELHGHGGPVVMRLLLARVLEAGASLGVRLAQPGEFTRRAFLNDKLDLAQAEAVADLIDASTEAAARSAARSLDGDFSRRVQEMVDALIHLRMLVEATLDFPEEDIDFIRQHDARGKLHAVQARLREVLAASRQGALLRSGLNVVLAGEPNVGKSSLLNALAGSEVAIVTPIAGTTRDRVVQQIQIEGIPLNVIDTAGLRDTEDAVERIGIERTWQEVARADVVLRLRAVEAGPAAGTANVSTEFVDGMDPASGGKEEGSGGTPASDGTDALTARILSHAPRGVPVLTVVNKIDLRGESPVAGETEVRLSARTGAGVDLLRRRLLEIAGWQGGGEDVILARERHLVALRQARDHLEMADAHVGAAHLALELFAEELRLAQQALSAITGEFTADDLLGMVFSSFCIGK